MPSARAGFVIAFAFALSCTSTPPRQCPTGLGGAPFGAGGAGTDLSTAECTVCLDTLCGYQKGQCDAECLAIQACLDTVCFNLSVTASSTEEDCQLYCQGLHPSGKVAHRLWVDCVQLGCCEPPCAAYPDDYDRCVIAQNAGACQAAGDACMGSSACQSYQSCASTCTTFRECQACFAGAGAVGEQLYEAWQLCLDTTCFAQGWLPANSGLPPPKGPGQRSR